MDFTQELWRSASVFDVVRPRRVAICGVDYSQIPLRDISWIQPCRAILELMWFGFDPELRNQLETIRQMVRLSHQTPTREWPLVFMEQYDALLVVREWPDGSLTAYSTSDFNDNRK